MKLLKLIKLLFTCVQNINALHAYRINSIFRFAVTSCIHQAQRVSRLKRYFILSDCNSVTPNWIWEMIHKYVQFARGLKKCSWNNIVRYASITKNLCFVHIFRFYNNLDLSVLIWLSSCALAAWTFCKLCNIKYEKKSNVIGSWRQFLL